MISNIIFCHGLLHFAMKWMRESNSIFVCSSKELFCCKYHFHINYLCLPSHFRVKYRKSPDDNENSDFKKFWMPHLILRVSMSSISHLFFCYEFSAIFEMPIPEFCLAMDHYPWKSDVNALCLRKWSRSRRNQAR